MKMKGKGKYIDLLGDYVHPGSIISFDSDFSKLGWNHRLGVSKNSGTGTPKWMVKIMENPIF